MIVFYIVGLSTKNLRNTLFVDSIDSIIEKMVVMMRTTIEEKGGPKKVFEYFPIMPHLKHWFTNMESEFL
jgi:hypothetical protein